MSKPRLFLSRLRLFVQPNNKQVAILSLSLCVCVCCQLPCCCICCKFTLCECVCVLAVYAIKSL